MWNAERNNKLFHRQTTCNQDWREPNKYIKKYIKNLDCDNNNMLRITKHARTGSELVQHRAAVTHSVPALANILHRYVVELSNNESHRIAVSSDIHKYMQSRPQC